MTSRLVSLAMRMWPRAGQVAKPQQSWATADLWRRVISASNSDDEDEIEAIAEVLDRLAAEFEEEEAARHCPPSASEEAVQARRECVRDHYRSLVAGGPAARNSPFDNGVVTSSTQDAEPTAGNDRRDRERLMRETEAQQLYRPNLDIPINGGEEYVTLAQ